MANGVVHFEICVGDISKGSGFYKNLFGWETKEYEGMGGYVGVEGQGEGTIGGGIMQAEEGKFPPYVTFYVEVDDIDAALAKANELGGNTIVPQTPIPGMGAFGLFTDPDGNMIGVYKGGS